MVDFDHFLFNFNRILRGRCLNVNTVRLFSEKLLPKVLALISSWRIHENAHFLWAFKKKNNAHLYQLYWILYCKILFQYSLSQRLLLKVTQFNVNGWMILEISMNYFENFDEWFWKFRWMILKISMNDFENFGNSWTFAI